jgi:hypothetical protein
MCSDEDFTELRRRVDALEVRLAAEREVGAAVAEGNKNVPAIVAALRKRAEALTAVRAPGFGHAGIFEHPDDVERRTWLGRELYALAAEIEQAPATERKNHP